jgi:hypothetical protein
VTPGFTRRELLETTGRSVAGAAALGTLASFPPPAQAVVHRTPGRRLNWILDMVESNPGEPLTQSSFNDPRKLRGYGYTGQIVNEWRPPQTAITFDTLSPEIFPSGSDARAWVEQNAARIDARIQEIHAAGLKALYFTDIIILPKSVVDLYGSEILDGVGRITLDQQTTQDIHRLMLAEVFDRFPALDGLVIRTGETYLQDLPYHTGNDPITRAADSHLILLGILRDEVCVKRGKFVVYRTWSFDGFHTDPAYYLSVTDRVLPHPLLIFSIKHTKGDFWRTVPFNPTLTIGHHQQIVEVQCQREYEGKGAHPNYVIDGVVNGFEEFRSHRRRHVPIGLADIREHPNFVGVWTWSRGGGWRGPYLSNELWCELNAYVMSHWAQDVSRSEASVFDDYMTRVGLRGSHRTGFRMLALLSATAVLHGHYSTLFRLGSLTWTRDEFLGGSDKDLAHDFQRIYDSHHVDGAIVEKGRAVAVWEQIARLAGEVAFPGRADGDFVRASAQYGLLLYAIIHHGWAVMLKGVEGDHTHSYDVNRIAEHVGAYDRAWTAYEWLRQTHPASASLYVPYGFGPQDPQGLYNADPGHGMKPSVDRYRLVIPTSQRPGALKRAAARKG